MRGAGRSALDHYRNDDAIVHLERCLAVWPDDPGAHLLAARAGGAERAGFLDLPKMAS